jgi:glycosyltransferase involved in cell wall biosynthesis
MHFAIFGDGPLYHDIIKETKYLKNVTCLGWQVDLSRVMSSLSLLVLTSDNEGIPLSVMEAASIGIPTVALNSGGVSEFVLDGVTGMIVEHEEQLGHAITQLLTDYELLSRMGAAAQSRALKDFGLRQYLESHEDVYLTLLKGRSPDTLQ